MKSKTKMKGSTRKARKTNLLVELKASLKELTVQSTKWTEIIEYIEDSSKKNNGILHETRLLRNKPRFVEGPIPPKGPPSDVLKKIKEVLKALSELDIATEVECRGGKTRSSISK